MNSKIFVDTAPFIYFLEKSPLYFLQVRDFLYSGYKSNSIFYTSVISIMEFSVLPLRKGRDFLIENFQKFVTDTGFLISPVDHDVAVKAAQLRSRYSFLRSMDAIQLAAAINWGCDIFFTNDIQLQKVTEIKVVLVSDL